MATNPQLINNLSATSVLSQAFRAILQNPQALQQLASLTQRQGWITGARHTAAALADSKAFEIINDTVEKNTLPPDSEEGHQRNKLFYDNLVFAAIEFLTSTIEATKQQHHDALQTTIEKELEIEIEKIEDSQKRIEDEQSVLQQEEKEKTLAELSEQPEEKTQQPFPIIIPVIQPLPKIAPQPVSQALVLFDLQMDPQPGGEHQSGQQWQRQQQQQEQAPTQDHYQVLGIEQNATPQEVRKAYRKQALANHPDKVPDAEKPKATEQFKIIQSAYETLNDPQSRSIYDAQRASSVSASRSMSVSA